MILPLLPLLTSTRCQTRPDGMAANFSAGATYWRCTLTHKGKRMSVYYSMGSALKGSPDAKYVLESLFMDAQTPDAFPAFCSEFGYDEDSRKAEATWKACRSIGIRLQKLLGRDFDGVKEEVEQ